VDHGAAQAPDEAGAEEISQELARQLVPRIAPRQRKRRSIQNFFKTFEIVTAEISFFCTNSFGKTIGAPETASARERPVSSLGCAQRQRRTQGISSA
jgi:hypothetical protein